MVTSRRSSLRSRRRAKQSTSNLMPQIDVVQASGQGASGQTALELARKAGQHMQQHGIEQARLESELLLAETLGIKRLELYMQFDRPVTHEELEKFRSFVRRRLKREPLQYIVGHTAFRKLVLHVDRRVLI